MKWIYTIPQKFKAAILLMIIILTVALTSFWGKSSVASMNKSFTSFYKDRLLPANELFHINDIMYQKRLIMHDYIDKKSSAAKTAEMLSLKNAQIDSILVEYDKTYLVAEEIKSLTEFKNKVQSYNMAEAKFINSKEPDPGLYEDQLVLIFDEIREELVTLSQIQTKVGKELLNNSDEIKAHASIIHYCQLAVILILLLIVQAIILSARSIIPKKPQDFTMN